MIRQIKLEVDQKAFVLLLVGLAFHTASRHVWSDGAASFCMGGASAGYILAAVRIFDSFKVKYDPKEEATDAEKDIA